MNKTKKNIKDSNKNTRVFIALLLLSLILNFILAYKYLVVEKPSDSVAAKPINFLKLNEPLSCENTNIDESQLPECPQGKGLKILPPYYPLHSIYMGYQEGIEQTGLFHTTLNILNQMKPRVPMIVMVPRNQMEKAIDELGPFISSNNKSLVRLMYTPSDYTVWTQDYFEFAVDGRTKTPYVLDLPYYSASGEHIPTTLSTACNYNLIGQSAIDIEKVETPAGNFGGNIEALTDNLVIVGNTISKQQKTHLESKIDQKILELNVNWLKVGHIDELISVIPVKERAGKCPFDIAYSSSGKALDLLKSESPHHKESLELRIGFGDTKQFFDLWKCFRGEDSGQGCATIKSMNIAYDKIIMENIFKIKTALSNYDKSCSEVKFKPIPVLFSASNIQKKYGSKDDGAITLEPNPVNNVVIGEHILIPKQNLDVFHSFTQDTLKEYKMQLTFVDGKYVHYFGGGIHCSLNFQRSCRPVKMN